MQKGVIVEKQVEEIVKDEEHLKTLIGTVEGKLHTFCVKKYSLIIHNCVILYGVKDIALETSVFYIFKLRIFADLVTTNTCACCSSQAGR